MEDIREELQDILSLVSLLESEMEVQKIDDIYIRITRIIHKMLNKTILEFGILDTKQNA